MTIDSTPDTAPGPTGDIEARVLKVIATTKRIPRESVTPDSTFEALGIDSLDRLNILFDLESEFDIQINDEDAKRVETIPQMVEGVRQLVAAKAEGAAEPTEAPASATPHPATPKPSMPSLAEAPGADPSLSRTKPASSGE